MVQRSGHFNLNECHWVFLPMAIKVLQMTFGSIWDEPRKTSLCLDGDCGLLFPFVKRTYGQIVFLHSSGRDRYMANKAHVPLKYYPNSRVTNCSQYFNIFMHVFVYLNIVCIMKVILRIDKTCTLNVK